MRGPGDFAGGKAPAGPGPADPQAGHDPDRGPGTAAGRPLRLLLVEDSARDAEIIIRELRRGGFEVAWTRVETGPDMAAALDAGPWDAVISDWRLPRFDGMAALRTLRAKDADMPFIIVSGTIGEDTAVAAMKAGAHDYLMKGDLARLAPAVARELDESVVRREHRALDEKIRDSALQWRATFDAMQEAVALLDPELRIMRCNAALKALIGKPFRDIVGRACHLLIHGTPEPPQECPTVRARRSLKRETWETMLGGRWFDVTADPVVGADGRLTGIVHVLADITGRKKAEEDLRTSEAQLSNALKIAKAGHWEYDVPSDTFTFNDNFFRIFGASAGELGGYTMRSADYARRFCHPDDREQVGREVRAAIEADDPAYSRQIEHRILYANGEVGYIAVRLFIVKDGQGRTIRTYGVNQDITERRKAAEAVLAGQAQVRRALEATAVALAATLEKRDPYTAGHQQRSTRLALAIAGELGLSEERTAGLYVASILHDVGKISVPAEILSKPGRLSANEYSFIQMHVQAGYEILKDIQFPWPIAEMVYQHHERENGSGYPRGLSGGSLLLEAKILAVADVVEAMASHRPYRPALGVEAALAEITGNRGLLYDADVVKACVKVFRERGFEF